VWPGGRTVWPLMLKQKRTVDVLIAVRLEPVTPFKIFDYYVIPKGAELRGAFHIHKRNNAAFIHLHRTDSLRPYNEAFRRTPIPVSA
jgi:hypothetical protein